VNYDGEGGAIQEIRLEQKKDRKIVEQFLRNEKEFENYQIKNRFFYFCVTIRVIL
jgi:hypothetical protein